MTLASPFDSIEVDHLRRIGGLKWSMFPDTVGAFVAEMDFGVAPGISRALHSAVDQGLFGYLPTAVSDEMSQATADWLRDVYGWTVPASDVHPIADVIHALELAMAHFSTPGAPVIVPTPAYMPFLSVPPAAGREVIQVPMTVTDGRYTLDLEGIDAAFRAGATLLILCNPFNPVGRVFDRAELLAVSEVVARHGGRVFSDEIHAPLVYAPGAHIPYASISDAAAAHTVTATSASKAWNLPGLKTAQIIITNDGDREIWERIGMMASHGASNLGVIANTAAYRDDRTWLADVVEYLDGNRRFLGEALAARIPEIAYRAPEGTYIGWLDARALDLSTQPADFFRENAGVALTDGSATGVAGVGFMRFVFATPRPIIEQAVDRMAEALARR
ncbi:MULTISPECIES: MalY/PatB family protein [unclassified Microbacterium]|uniref:MalY/PatB family protein n=1 Tax=unclassified Microbacterium TaxID=2609290 RepID=UPI000EA8D508|nr:MULTISPECIES: aminotransferase class I/II-fold pyridoxal phosphate-dependent enzyme [unclassified Microbacterium]MBT2483884.1 aminotransferase class I/II-fold pyridoxal phosphate-dependent enzyme [Microbacterium sp. ISL-108]RKN66864.1 aminotransferase class I/II-fold pyridoxal phosphate-dependent enzyme [Microbacterium sp. CGR2]